MKTVKVLVLPSCDFCEGPAEYDAPTLDGPWAFMCGPDKLMFGTPNPGIGSHLVLMTDEEKAIDAAIARHPSGAEAKAARREKAQLINAAVQSGDWSEVEDLVGDGDISEWI
jgi:hypothetical protein